jgi:hypothetical protein
LNRIGVSLMDLRLNIIESCGRKALPIRLRFVLYLLPCLLLVANCATVKQVKELVHKDYGLPKKVMLVNAANRTGYPMGGYLGKMEEQLLSKLKDSKDLKVVMLPSQLSKEPSLENPGEAALKGEMIVSRAKQAGVSILIRCDISEFEIRHQLKGLYGFRKEKAIMSMQFLLEAIDVETGAILYHNYRKGEMNIQEDVSEQEYLNKNKTPPLELANSSINNLAEEAVDAMAAQPWKGFVTDVTDGRVSFQAGKDVGLMAGTRLQVRGHGQKMVNLMGDAYQAPGSSTGTIRIENVGESSSTGIIEEKGNVQPGDTLVLLSQ